MAIVKIIKELFLMQNLTVFEWISQFPDLNPIEHL